MFQARRDLNQRIARLGLAALIGFGLLTAQAKEPVMNKTKSICFGRFMIDLPEGAEIKEMGQQSEFMFALIESEATSLDEKAFAARMEKREADLRAGKQKDGFALANSYPSTDSRVFTLTRTFDLFPNDPPSMGLEMYRLNGGQLFSMEKTGFNKTFPKIVERLRAKTIPGIRARQPDEIPAEPGFCIKDGFIADDGSKEQHEQARIQINFKAWPDVWVKVMSQTVPKAGDTSLLQRVDAAPAIPTWAASKFKTLRRGVHEVHGRKGEEILELLPTDEGFQEFSFIWEANGEVKSVLAPRLVFELVSASSSPGGVRRPPTTTNDQAIKLFDGIVNSIRLRPTSAPKVSSVGTPPLVPLGELVATGRACPQPGWWECAEEARPVQGGKRQFFRGGDRMPHAILQGVPSMWQKLKGDAPTYRVATVWKLVEYEAQPLAAADGLVATPANEGHAQLTETPPSDDDKPANA